MKLLALDTSTEACSAALYLDGELRERYELAPQMHAQLLLPMIDVLMTEAGIGVTQLDALAFGRGPGSFTGLRIAAGVTQGIAFGADIPVVPVSSLAALAQGLYRECGVTQVLTAMDARMNEVYWGIYQTDTTPIMCLQGQEQVCAPNAVSLPKGYGWFGAGSGWGVYAEALQHRLAASVTGCDVHWLPHAQDVALLGVDAFHRGGAARAEEAVPVYLRDEVAKKQSSLA